MKMFNINPGFTQYMRPRKREEGRVGSNNVIGMGIKIERGGERERRSAFHFPRAESVQLISHVARGR